MEPVVNRPESDHSSQQLRGLDSANHAGTDSAVQPSNVESGDSLLVIDESAPDGNLLVMEARSEDVVVVEEDHIVGALIPPRMPAAWLRPPSQVTITIKDGYAFLDGRIGTHAEPTPDPVEWCARASHLTSLTAAVRRSLEKLRREHTGYLDAIDGQDLLDTLAAIQPEERWDAPNDAVEDTYLREWETVSAGPALAELVDAGWDLFEEVFPTGSELRQWIDRLVPGSRINFRWYGPEARDLQVPWALMYRFAPNASPEINPMGFFGLAFRIGYDFRRLSPPLFPEQGLGRLEDSCPAYFLYWGGQENDLAAVEAEWQRGTLGMVPKQTVLPSMGAEDPKAEVVQFLRNPSPGPIPVLYLYCKAGGGADQEPDLRFGSTNDPNNILRKAELGSTPIPGRPLVFVNACSSAEAAPGFTNLLEQRFFKLGCRSYIGTESKIPVRLASRFATTFFHFFYRRVEPLAPVAAGEALAQTRRLLWNRYRNIGGLFYTQLNRYAVFMARDEDLY